MKLDSPADCLRSECALFLYPWPLTRVLALQMRFMYVSEGSRSTSYYQSPREDEVEEVPATRTCRDGSYSFQVG